MYNKDIKERYITEKESNTSLPEGYLTKQFSKSESFEKLMGKDLCNFTKHEILNMYKTFNTSSLESLTVVNSHFSLYTQWCLYQNLVDDCQNHFAEIQKDNLMSCVNILGIKKSIITRETLLEWINKMPNPADAFILIALFEGIKGKEFCELVNLKMSDFNGNKVKLCTGRELEVSDELVNIAMESNDTYKYYAITGKGNKVIKLKEEDLIIKNYPNTEDIGDTFQIGRRVYRRLLRAFDYLGVSDWMKPNSISESGKIYYINKRSEELGMTAQEYLCSPYVKEIVYKYDYNTKRRHDFLTKYEDFLS